jgi:hypothetical protein
MNEFPFTLKLVLFIVEAVIFLAILIKSGKLATLEEHEFLEGEKVRIAGERARAPGL